MKQCLLLATIIFLCVVDNLNAQTTGDFRSHQTGNWNSTSTWERWNGVTWVTPAPLTPTNSDGLITIRSTDTVTVTLSVSADSVWIIAGGRIVINASTIFNVTNVNGDDILVDGTLENKGTFTLTASTMYVSSLGTYIHNTTAGAAAVLNSTVLGPGSTWIYRGSGTVTPAVSMSGRTYSNLIFESTSGSWSSTITGTSATSCTNFSFGSNVTMTNNYTGVLTVGGDFTINGSIVNGTGTQFFLLNGSGKTIGGTASGLTNFYDTLSIPVSASYTLVTNLTGAASSKIILSGTLINQAQITPPSVGMILNSGGTFVQNSTLSPATLLSSTNQISGSNWIYRGSGSLTPSVVVSGISFGNLSFESTSGTWSTSLSGSSASFCTNFSVGSGVTLTNDYTGSLSVTGNFTLNGSLINGIGTQSFSLLGSGKTISGAGLPGFFDALTITSGASYSVTNSSLVVSGTLTNQGTLSFPSGSMTVNSGATYVHNTTSGAGSVLDSTTLNSNSTWIYRGSSVTSPSVAVNGRTFGHLSFESTSGTWSASVSATSASSCNNFNLGSSVTITDNSTAPLTVSGDFILNGTLINGTGTQIFLLTGAGKSISGSGLSNFSDSLTIEATGSYTLLNNLAANSGSITVLGSLGCGTNTINTTSPGIFRLAAGATLKTGNASGVSSTVFGLGTQFSTQANYEFTGSVTQTTFFPTTTINSLTINTTGGAQVNLNTLSLTVNGTITLTAGLFNVGTNNLNLYGPPIAGTATNFITTSSSTLQFYGSSAGVFIPSTVTSLVDLYVNKTASDVTMNSNITLSGTLYLISGNLVTGPFTISATGSGGTFGGSASSYVKGTLIKRFSGGGSLSQRYPVGVNSYQAIIISGVSVSAATDLQVIPFETAPSGTPDGTTLHQSIVNRYWNLKVIGTNSITALGVLNLKPASPFPDLSSNSLVAYSLNNAAASYSSLGGTLVSDTLKSTIALSAGQISDLATSDGSFVGIGQNKLLAGIYCIGPLAFYSPPSGPAYINGNSPYHTLTAAVNDLNTAGTLGHVIFEFQNDYTSASESVPINITYQGTSGATAVFRPRSDLSGQLVIAKSAASATSGVINLNGADYITFDGSPGGVLGTTVGIILRNTTAAASTTTLYVVNDATNIMLNAIDVEGTLSGKVITIDSTNGSNGNDFITIQNCELRDRSDVSVSGPYYCVYASSSETGASCNNDLVIQKNKIFNWILNAMSIGGGNNGNLLVDGNSFFSNSSTPPAGSTLMTFGSNETSVNLTITNNYIGGTAANTSGSPLTLVAQYVIVTQMNATNVVNISSNIIRNISFTSTFALTMIHATGIATIQNNIIGNPVVPNDLTYAANANATFIGIHCISSQNISGISITNNSLNNFAILDTGANSSATFIKYFNTTLTNGTATISGNAVKNFSFAGKTFFTGLDITGNNGTGNTIVSNNLVEGITQTQSSAKASVTGITFTGISCNAGPASITGNRIGSFSLANNINLAGAGICTGLSVTGNIGSILVQNDTVANITSTNGTSSTVQLQGINGKCFGSASMTVSSNVIKNLSTASIKNCFETTPATDLSLAGIVFSGSSSTVQSINNNSISGLNLTTTSSSANPVVAGIGNNASRATYSSNYISSLTNAATNTSSFPIIIGIQNLSSGIQAAFINNTIAISNGANSNGVLIYGMYDTNPAGTTINEIYYNSISIAGTGTGNVLSTPYYFNRISLGTTLRNNIFHNTRTGGTKNYAIANIQANTAFWISTTSNFNDLFSSNASTAGLWGTADKTFATWKSTTGGDASSKNVAAVFTNPLSDLHLQTNGNCTLDGGGTPVSGITTDYDGNTRNATVPDIGADEFGSSFSVNAGNDSSVCSTVNLNGSTIPSGGTGTWAVVSGTASFSPNANTPNATATGLTTGLNKLKWTVTSGTCSLSDTVSVTRYATPTAAISGDTTLCSGSPTNLKITLTGTPNWNIVYQDNLANTVNVNGISSSPATVSVTPPANRTYTLVSVTEGHACTGTVSGSAVVTVLPLITYYADSDNDGYGVNGDTLRLCAPSGIYRALVGGDCNDTVAGAHPGASEVCCNGIDDNCNGQVDESCPLRAGVYCIGPGASYTPPSGPAYINGTSPYANLTAAVNAINASGACGNVVFELQNNYTSSTETFFPINITYQGTPTTTLVIRPRSDVSGMLIISGPADVIGFNGADYVTIDGSPGGTMDTTVKLMVRNSSSTILMVSANIRFVNDATHNTINAVQVEGSGLNNCITIDTTNGTSGNDFTTIQNCILRNRSDATDAPQNGIYAQGTLTGGLKANSDIVIQNNRIFNCTLNGIHVNSQGNNGRWVINGNHFYSTFTGVYFETALKIQPTDTVSLTVSNNFIGGSGPSAVGNMQIATGFWFKGIYLILNDASSTVSSVSNNTIKNIFFNGNLSYGLIAGIDVQSGVVNITGNTIGDPAIPLTINSTNNVNTSFYGISYTSSQNVSSVSFSNNLINGVMVQSGINKNIIGFQYTNTSLTNGIATIANNRLSNFICSVSGTITCIKVAGGNGSPANTFITDNKIDAIQNLNASDNSPFTGISCNSGPASITGNRIGGYTTANDITISTGGTHMGISVLPGNGSILVQNDTIANMTLTKTNTSAQLWGIYHGSSGAFANKVSTNVIKNLSTASTKSSLESDAPDTYALTGIVYFTSSFGQSVLNNSISGLRVTTTSSTANPAVSGISIISGSNIEVLSNSIYDLTNTATNTSSLPLIFGLRVFASASDNFYNNMIGLSNGSNTNGVRIYGIYDNSFNSLKVYAFNSVAITGTGSGNSRSAAFWRNTSGSGASMKDNIFYNSRTGGIGKKYAIVHETGTSANWTSLASNYNNLYTSDTSALGMWGGVDKSFTTWKSTSLGDANSKNTNISFVNITNDLHLLSTANCLLEGTGTPVVGITTDYDETTRNATTPDIGADEFTGPNKPKWYADADLDGYGNLLVFTYSCLQTPGYVADSTDCNDADSLQHPNQLWYTDVDNDDYGTGVFVVQCSRPSGKYAVSELISITGDCNDTVASIHPGAAEICCNQIDDNCDGFVDEGCPLSGKYCIGPSASYTPPSGTPYINATAPYATLTSAVNALNALGACGNVIFEFQNNYAGTSETYPITITYQGSPTTTAVFRPRSDKTGLVSISGALAGNTTGMILFNGADYITFDGSKGGTLDTISSFSMKNTSSSNGAAPIFYFSNDATHNKLNSITMEGGKLTLGCVFLAGSNGTTGNDFNTIQNCFISGRLDLDQTFAPVNGIYIMGSVSNPKNSDVVISGNKIVNIDDGIHFEPVGADGNWTITGNHFYYTNTVPGPKISEPINFSSNGPTVAVISNNFIGGSAPYCGGAAMNDSSSLGIICISAGTNNSTSASSINGNVIKNIKRTGTVLSSFRGIVVTSGPVNITNNTIGNPDVADDILCSSQTTEDFLAISSTSFHSNVAVSVSDNSINNITLLNTTGTFGIFSGIYYTNNFLANASATFSGNTIRNIRCDEKGGIVCMNISGGQGTTSSTLITNNKMESISSTVSTGGVFKGIYCDKSPVILSGNRIGKFNTPNDISISGSGAHLGYATDINVTQLGPAVFDHDTLANISFLQSDALTTFTGIYSNSSSSTLQANSASNNVLKNISVSSTKSADENSIITEYALTGIRFAFYGSNQSVKNNVIGGLHATTTSASSNPVVAGISVYDKDISVEANSISDLTNTATNTSVFPVIFGIRMYSVAGGGLCLNNMISLNNTPYTNGVNIYGIYDDNSSSTTPSTRYYYNSISIGGTTSGASKSGAFWRNATNSLVSLRNNIFYNTRSGGTLKHFAIVYQPGSTLYWPSSTSDYNNLFTSDTSAVGSWGGVAKIFSAWKSVTSGDSHSKNVNTSFVDLAQNNLHLTGTGNCFLDGTGIPVGGITKDYDAQTRNATTPDIGADEFTNASVTEICGNGFDDDCDGQIDEGCYGGALSLNLRVFIEGFYVGSETMNLPIDPYLVDTISDVISVQLYDSLDLYTVAASDTVSISIHGFGSATFNSPLLISGHSYYIAILHRNSIETWSSYAVLYTGSPINFDFTRP